MRNDLHWRRFRGAVRACIFRRLAESIAAGYAADAARAARAERVREQRSARLKLSPGSGTLSVTGLGRRRRRRSRPALHRRHRHPRRPGAIRARRDRAPSRHCANARRRASLGDRAPDVGLPRRPAARRPPLAAASACRRALEPYVEDDWAVQAGHLAWDVRQTITHVCDAVGWFAAHLAFRSPRRLRFDFHAHRDASNAEMLDVLEAAAATLGQLARAAPADARAYHNTGMADADGFLAMGCDEILVHGWRSAASGRVRCAGGPRRAPAPQALALGSHRSGALAGPALRKWARRPSGTARRPGPDWVRQCARPSTSGTARSRAKMPTRPPATNGTTMPAAGAHTGNTVLGERRAVSSRHGRRPADRYHSPATPRCGVVQQ